jgi:hypothetical protein
LLTEAQRLIAALLQSPESNSVVFDIAANPVIANMAGDIREPAERYIEQQFAAFQGRTPQLSLLDELAGGRPPEMAEMLGF